MTTILVILAATACGDTPTPTSPTSATPRPPTTGGDPAPPSVTCPANVTAASSTGSPVSVSYTPPAPNGGVAPVTVSCTPASGTAFPVGTTSVRCTATASNGETGSCTFSVTVAAPPRLSRTRFLAFGDSLTEGEVTVPVSQATGEGAGAYPSFGLRVVPEASYPTQLQLLLRARYTAQAPSIAVTNAGRAGERATEGALRFPDLIANLRPEVVLLLAGANDLAGLGNAGVSSAVLGVEAMAKEARFRNARVFIAAMTPPRPGQRALSPSLVQTYNTRLEAIARGEGAVFVDLYAALLANVNGYIGVDGLHPTEAGYRRMAEAFFDSIQQDLEVR